MTLVSNFLREPKVTFQLDNHEKDYFVIDPLMLNYVIAIIGVESNSSISIVRT